MKKLIALLLCIILLLSLASCSSKNTDRSTNPADKNDVKNTATAADAKNSATAAIEKTMKFVEMTPEVPNQYYAFSDDMGMFSYNSKWGYLDRNGKVLIEPKYKMANSFSEGYALVKNKDDKVVILDKKGNETVLNDKYDMNAGYLTTDNHYSFHEGLAVVLIKKSASYAVIDTTGKEIFVMDKGGTYGYSPKGYYSGGVMVWMSFSNFDNALIMITDKMGNVVARELKTGYNTNAMPTVHFTDNLLALPNPDNTWNVIDTNAKKVLSEDFEKLKQPSEGLIPFLKYAKWGYIDYKGKVVIEAQYEDAFSFSNGLAAVKMNGKIGYIDASNKMVIQPQFAETKFSTVTFHVFDKNGVSVVPDNNGSVIDKTGKVLLSSAFAANIMYDGNGIICFYNGNKSGLYKLVTE